jgi:hypothetical protein
MTEMSLDVPRGLADVCRPDRLALVVYDMQVGIISQMKSAPAILPVWSRPLMGHPYRVIRRMRYGPSSSWERHDDRGGPSSDTA